MRDKRYIRDLARQRIEWLVKMADSVFRDEPELADRYIDIAMRIAQKARIHYPPILKARACRRCGAYLVPGVTAQVRIVSEGKRKIVVVRCLKCGYTRRYPLGGSSRRKGMPWLPLYREKKYMRRL